MTKGMHFLSFSDDTKRDHSTGGAEYLTPSAVKYTVVLLTCKQDMTSTHIGARMQARQVPFIRFDTGDFPSQAVLNAQHDGGAWYGTLTAFGETIPLERVKSILYRRPTHYQVSN